MRSYFLYVGDFIINRILSLMRQAIQTYNMINTGDKVAVGLSGGKDSLVLLEGLSILREYFPAKFEVTAITIDNGFKNTNYSSLDEYCKSRYIPYYIIQTNIKKFVFENSDIKNPCSLCSRIRRGALCNAAVEHGCTKIALGHNREDANETLLMNLFYNGKIECFEPITQYNDKSIDIIRPLVYVPERLIKSVAYKYELPIITATCPVSDNTDRDKIKNLISELSRDNKKIRESIFTAIKKHDIFSSKESDKNEHSK